MDEYYFVAVAQNKCFSFNKLKWFHRMLRQTDILRNKYLNFHRILFLKHSKASIIGIILRMDW